MSCKNFPAIRAAYMMRGGKEDLCTCQPISHVSSR
jgi:hypothetical protein